MLTCFSQLLCSLLFPWAFFQRGAFESRVRRDSTISYDEVFSCQNFYDFLPNLSSCRKMNSTEFTRRTFHPVVQVVARNNVAGRRRREAAAAAAATQAAATQAAVGAEVVHGEATGEEGEAAKAGGPAAETLLLMDGMVLDVSRWLEEHPGGSTIIPEQALDLDCTVPQPEAFECAVSLPGALLLFF